MISGQGFRIGAVDPPGIAASRASRAPDSPEILRFPASGRPSNGILGNEDAIEALPRTVERPMECHRPLWRDSAHQPHLD